MWSIYLGLKVKQATVQQYSFPTPPLASQHSPRGSRDRLTHLSYLYLLPFIRTTNDSNSDFDIPLTAESNATNAQNHSERTSVADSPIQATAAATERKVTSATATPIVKEEDQKYIVGWDGPGDPANPLNWPPGKKWANLAIISSMTLISSVASSMIAPGAPDIMAEFSSDNLALASFVVSVYVLGFSFGPMVTAPLSEIYGRRKVYLICNLLFFIFTTVCGESKGIDALVTFRFLAGCVGVAPITLGGGSIGDLMVPKQRGAAVALFSLGPLIGSIIGPIAGGYLVQEAGWRWVFRVLAIASLVLNIISLGLSETYAPVLIEAKAKKLRSKTGNEEYRSKYVTNINLRRRVVFERAIMRPLKLLFMSPIVSLLSLYMAVIYGYQYLLLTTLTIVFERLYQFSAGPAGLSFLGLGLGSIIGALTLGVANDKIFVALAKYNNNDGKPEYRLPLMTACSLLIPVGLFWYGWAAINQVHWIVPIIGTAVVAVGMVSVLLLVQCYLIDAFTHHAASAIAAGVILRSVFGALLPLAGQPMYEELGIGWGNNVLGLLALSMVPIPWVFWQYGERIRTRYPIALD